MNQERTSYMKKIISFVLVICLCITMNTAVIAAAKENATYNDNVKMQQSVGVYGDETAVSIRTNYNFIQIEDMSAVEYTYEEGGKTYLVKESANDNLSFIETIIYEISDNNVTLVETFTTSVSVQDGTMFLEKNDNGIITTNVVDTGTGDVYLQVPEYHSEFSEHYTIYNSECIDASLPEIAKAAEANTHPGSIRYCYIHGHYFTNWFYKYTSNGSNFVLNLTLTVLTSVILGIITDGVSVAIQIGASAVAGAVLLYSLTNLYFTSEVHQLWEVTSSKEYIGWAVGERRYTTFYIDSARKQALAETGFSEWQDPTYYPKNCMMT